MNIVDWIIIIWTGAAFLLGVKIGRFVPLIKLWTGLMGGVVAVCLNAVLIFFTVSAIIQNTEATQIQLAIQESTIGAWIIIIGGWTYVLVG